MVISDDDLVFQNAFSSKLAQFGFCLYPMLVVDLMHEFELGVWKAVFIHLLRILDCESENLKHKLDRRYVYLKLLEAVNLMAFRFREIPPFGRDGVRKTTSNRSELKKMTAHDYEDMLQVGLELYS